MTEQKTILITGASSGIGEAIALEMAKDGHIFFLTGRNEHRLLSVKNKVEKYKATAHIGLGNVADPVDVNKLYTTAQSLLGFIDVLVANAGVGYLYYLEDTPIEYYDLMFNTNVKGVFLWLRNVLPEMKMRNKGQIIVTSSTSGFQTFEEASIYCATKHAIQGMIGALRKELSNTKVKVATLNPGAVNTPWFDKQTNFSSLNRSKMLSAQDVAKAARLIIEQSETSNIDHILLKST